MLDHLNSVTSGMQRIGAVTLLSLSIAACGGSDSSSGGGNNVGGGGGGGGGGGSQPTVPTAEFSADGALSPKQSMDVTFSEAMDPDTLQLSGSIADSATVSWSDDNTVMTLAPASFWSPGANTLTMDATDAEGDALETVDMTFDVSAPFTNLQAASLVIGQPDFTSTQSRQGFTLAGANTLDQPLGAVAFAEEQNVLFVPDTYDSRVLGFNGLPEANNADAAFVIGQDSFTSSGARVEADGMTRPQGVTVSGGQLIVTDTHAQRLLVYSDVPTAGPAEAVVAVGQDDLVSSEVGCAANRFAGYHLHGHFVTPSGKLIAADSSNNRVLIWNSIPTESGTPADMVLGQADFTSCAINAGGAPTAATMNHPTGIWSDDERLFVADQENNRILVWNTFPTENFAEADYVLGQGDFTHVAANDDDQDGAADAAASARTLNFPWDVEVVNGMLFATDMENNRVLIWNEVPTESFAPADTVIGQADFAGMAVNAGGDAGASTFNLPSGVEVVGDQLYVTDWMNSRVLVFDVDGGAAATEE